MATFFQQLRHRRVPQILGAYAGAGLALIPFVGFLVDRYNWTPRLVDAVLAAFISLVPTIILVAWNHGAPGRDPWILAERVGIPFNLVVTAGLLVWIFRGPADAVDPAVSAPPADGAAIAGMTDQGAEGAQGRDSVTRLLLFFWDQDSDGASDDAWLRYGIPLLLEQNLEQNRFAGIRTPFSSNAVLTGLRRAGFQDALKTPRPLGRRLAEEIRQDRFLQGSYSREDGVFRLRAVLYETADAEPAFEYDLRAENFSAAVDLLAERMFDDLKIAEDESSQNLPISEHLSASPDALRGWAEARVASGLDNDYDAVVEHLREVVAVDPAFAMAQIDLAQALIVRGALDEAGVALRAARQHDYRLTDRWRFIAQLLEQNLVDRSDKVRDIYELWVERYPDDTIAIQGLARLNLAERRIDDAEAGFLRVLELDPAEDRNWLTLGQIRTARRDFDGAIESYRRYAELHPNDVDAVLSISNVERLRGDLAQARAEVERAALLTTGPQATLALAYLDLAEGDLESAQKRLPQAEAASRVEAEQAATLRAELAILDYRGRPSDILERLPRLRELQSKTTDPFNLEFAMLDYFGAYVDAGRRPELETYLQQISQAYDPPLNRYFDFLFMESARVAHDLEALKHWTARCEPTLADFRNDTLQLLMDLAQGRIAELEGDHDAAAAIYLQTLEALNGSLVTGLSTGNHMLFRVFHAEASLQAGDLKAVRSSLNEAARIAPGHPLVLLQQARLAHAEGERESARALLDRVLEIWRDAEPGFPEAAQARELRTSL